MSNFTIRDDFYLDDQPFKIISGAIHYFRVVPAYWRDRLEKLRAMGANTVETYVPWNMHEPQPKQYNFSGMLDLRTFIQTAQEVGLYVILRPSPYICAEWEFGGLPWWLQNIPEMKIRANNQPYLATVNRYYAHLFPQIADLQIDQDGPVILCQVENEFGSFGNDQNYLRKLAALMRKHGVTVPLVTADGPWGDMLTNGTVPELALPTINCGSKIKENFAVLRSFNGTKKKPLMVMEFWDGWFDAWGDGQHHTTPAEIAAAELNDTLAEGSINIYMFHGGTNFGFHNGSVNNDRLQPITTSYDYDAPLTEWGEETPKYTAFRDVISHYVDIPTVSLSADIQKKSYGTLRSDGQTDLWTALPMIGTHHECPYPRSMENFAQGYGYTYYETRAGASREIDVRLVGAADRAQMFVNRTLQATQYDRQLGQREKLTLPNPGENRLGVLVENMGRVDYSAPLYSQRKGIRDGVMVNGAFYSQWDIWALPMDHLERLHFSQAAVGAEQPVFYHFTFNVVEAGDTFIDLTGWGKGFVAINGFNLGRYWDIGPQKRLYLPAPLLHLGKNELIVFETEGRRNAQITLTDQPIQ